MKNNIAMLRKERRISQDKLGRMLGVKQSTISSWEKNRTHIDKDNLLKLSKLFKCTTGYLLGFEQERIIVPVSFNEYIDLGLLNPEDFFNDDDFYEPPERDDVIGVKEDSIYTAWSVKYTDMPYELYRIKLAMQHMNDNEKKRTLLIIRTAFPHAFD